MHSKYSSYLGILGVYLDQAETLKAQGRDGASLQWKARALVEFDRDIILAQRVFDAAECVRNSPITGDSKDMSAKNFPQFLRLDGRVYEYTPTDYKTAKEVVVKPDDEPVIVSLKYKVELDTSEVDAWLEKINSLCSRPALARALVNQALIDPAPFTLVNNGTINITWEEVESESFCGLIWSAINK